MNKWKIFLKAQGHEDTIIYITPLDAYGKSTKVDQIRQIIADSFHVKAINIIIIVAGKILKDEQTITQLKINDGHTLHAVFKSVEYKQIVARNNDAHGINYTARNTSHLPKRNVDNDTSGALFEMDDNYGLTNSQMEDLVRQLMDNPELLARYMQNPMIEKMCKDQNVLNELINGNQFLKDKMDKSNAVKEAVRSTESIKPWLEKLKNPNELFKLKRHRQQKEDQIRIKCQRIEGRLPDNSIDDSMDTEENLNSDQLQDKFLYELNQLKTLGFERNDNIQLLVKYQGTVNSVVDHYLGVKS